MSPRTPNNRSWKLTVVCSYPTINSNLVPTLGVGSGVSSSTTMCSADIAIDFTPSSRSGFGERVAISRPGRRKGSEDEPRRRPGLLHPRIENRAGESLPSHDAAKRQRSEQPRQSGIPPPWPAKPGASNCAPRSASPSSIAAAGSIELTLTRPIVTSGSSFSLTASTAMSSDWGAPAA